MVVLTGRLVDGRVARVKTVGDIIHSIERVETKNAKDLPWIIPGLVDLQVNGYGGIDFNSVDLTVEDVKHIVSLELEQGVTTFCPTIMTGPEEQMVNAMRVIRAACDEDSLVARALPAIHVEGPYLSSEDGPRGVHDVNSLRDPDLREFDRWQAASGNRVRIITIAPETAGALEYISAVSRVGVIASVGHTAADSTMVAAAVLAGARMSTHLGNGAHATISRHPNYIWAQLDQHELIASFVGDGHHLPEQTFRVMLRAKGLDRAIIVSDSIALAGLLPGDYSVPGIGDVTVGADRRVSLRGTPYLAGSGSSLLQCLSWVIRTAQITMRSAVGLATCNPAAILGLPDRAAIRVGAHSDMMLLSGLADSSEFTVLSTIAGGVVSLGSAGGGLASHI
jgi:N-acetylglucosamine-6-phosphate deacetylase